MVLIRDNFLKAAGWWTCLIVVIASPAFNLIAGCQGAIVLITAADLLKIAGWRIGLVLIVVSPAFDASRNVDAACAEIAKGQVAKLTARSVADGTMTISTPAADLLVAVEGACVLYVQDHALKIARRDR